LMDPPQIPSRTLRFSLAPVAFQALTTYQNKKAPAEAETLSVNY